MATRTSGSNHTLEGAPSPCYAREECLEAVDAPGINTKLNGPSILPPVTTKNRTMKLRRVSHICKLLLWDLELHMYIALIYLTVSRR